MSKMVKEKDKNVLTSLQVPMFIRDKLAELKIFSTDSYTDVIVGLILDRALLRERVEELERENGESISQIHKLRDEIYLLKNPPRPLTQEEIDIIKEQHKNRRKRIKKIKGLHERWYRGEDVELPKGVKFFGPRAAETVSIDELFSNDDTEEEKEK